MPRRSDGTAYPADWREIARRAKDETGWRCLRCGALHDPPGHVLTVHHLDMSPQNCAWWNLAVLCARCHLHIQSKVVMARVWMFDHTPWFRPYVAGYYAHLRGLPDDRASVEANLEDLLDWHRLPGVA